MDCTVLLFNKPISGLRCHLVVINSNFSYNTVFLTFITIIVLFFAQSLLNYQHFFIIIDLESLENSTALI